jgi:DNA-nicking Smr family endonuclease
MDFGEILEQWENRRTSRAGNPERVDMEDLLGRYPPAKDGRPSGQDSDEAGRTESRYQRMKTREPQAELDLHGLTAEEARASLERFLREARAQGLGKVLIIHGKGTHSRGKPVLEGTVRAWLERSPLAGAFGRAERRHGGGGATWVILRE